MAETRTILDVMTGPFAEWFPMATWRPWVLCAAAIFGLTHGLTPEDEAFILRCLGRKVLPARQATRVALVVGRRGGKSRFVAFLIVFLAAFKDYSGVLAPGERGVAMVICSDRKQARVVFRYVRALLRHPMLSGLVERVTQEGIDLVNGISIEIHTKSFRSVRGYTVVAYVLDEAAVLPDDESAEPDTELVNALDPAMATVPGAIGMLVSSPHARRGAFWRLYKEHFGVDADDETCVWQADTRTMNPTVSEAYIARKYAEDEVQARAEFGAEFRGDLEQFVSQEVLDTVTVKGRRELSPTGGHVAFVDPSGGAADSFTLAIAHVEGSGRVVLDCIREIVAPFDPELAVRQLAFDLRRFHVTTVTGDHYGGDWPASRFRSERIAYELSERDKSELYRATIPLLMTGDIEILDHPLLRRQLLALERTVSKSGKERIDHGTAGRDDVANAVCGALVLAYEAGLPREPSLAVVYAGNRSQPPDDSWRQQYYAGLRSRRTSLIPGLVDAPQPTHVSQAMLDARAEDRAAVEQQERFEREAAQQLARQREEDERARQQRADAEVRAALSRLTPEQRAKARRRFKLKERGDE